MLTELILSDKLDNLDFKQLGTVLSIFGDTKLSGNLEIDVTPLHLESLHKNIIRFINDKSFLLKEKESIKRLYLNTEWEINTGAMNATYAWLDGGDFNSISKQYGIYEGNLIKDFIRLYNLSATVMSIANILQKNTLEIAASKVMDVVMRGVVTIESLYIL